jgi:hypothetical protein
MEFATIAPVLRAVAMSAAAGEALDPLAIGKVDQRLEAWFRPFGGVSPNGYYRRREDEDGDRFPGPK